MTYDTLVIRLGEITKLLNLAEQAKSLPRKAEHRAKALYLDPYTRNNDTAYHKAFEACRDRFAEEEMKQAEIARDRELKRLSVELNKLREDLPQLASDARVDLFYTVRAWQEGGNQ